MKRAHWLGSSAVLLFVACASPAFAATYTVNAIADLQARIDAALPGDTIVVQNGVYTTSAAIAITHAARRLIGSRSPQRRLAAFRSPARTDSRS